jgi:2-polyprenyl-6-methoxyphenol hydroxylase-like FAD-dependent oxidoreductase
VVGVQQDDSAVTVTLESGEEMRTSLLVGADGVHSVVREQAQIISSRDDSGASYSLADVHLSGGVPNDELVVYFSSAGHLVVLPLPGDIHRLVAHVAEAPEKPDVAFLQRLIDTRGPQQERAVIHDVVWGSRFLTRHSLVDRYRSGRVVLAGDAAHEHSPLGGQGMNLGINDAIALGRMLSRMHDGISLDLLDSYDAMQRSIAKRVISITSWLTRAATIPEPLSLIRNLLVGALSPIIRRRLAWRLSQLGYLERNGSSRLRTNERGTSEKSRKVA